MTAISISSLTPFPRAATDTNGSRKPMTSNSSGSSSVVHVCHTPSQALPLVTVAGPIGTLERPRKAATKVRQAAELVLKKVRERYEASQPPNDQPAEGSGEMAA
jgi:hypothetical protein